MSTLPPGDGRCGGRWQRGVWTPAWPRRDSRLRHPSAHLHGDRDTQAGPALTVVSGALAVGAQCTVVRVTASHGSAQDQELEVAARPRGARWGTDLTLRSSPVLPPAGPLCQTCSRAAYRLTAVDMLRPPVLAEAAAALLEAGDQPQVGHPPGLHPEALVLPGASFHQG